MQHIKRRGFACETNFGVFLFVDLFRDSKMTTSFIKIDRGIQILKLKTDCNFLLLLLLLFFYFLFSECFVFT